MKKLLIAVAVTAMCFGQGSVRIGRSGVTASSLGAALDCRPDLGTPGANVCGVGITPTDDTTVLQAFLDTASASHPIHLIIDGPAYIHGLTLKAGVYTTIEGYGPQAGFWMKAGSNATAIDTVGSDSLTAATDNPGCGNNAVSTVSPGTPPTRTGGVTLRNFTVNGNRGTFSGATPPAYNRDGNATGVCWQGTSVYLFNFNLVSFAYVKVDNVVSLDSPSWNYKISNAIDVQFHGNIAKETYGTIGLVGGRIYNGDGLDLCGPIGYAHVSDFTANNTGDDGIAVTSIVGWTGAIDDVTITNYTSINNTSIMRLLPYASSGSKGHIGNVTVSNVGGNATENGIITGFSTVGAPTTVTDWISHLHISNTHFIAPTFLSFQQNPVGEVMVSNSSWSPILDNNAATWAAFDFNGVTSGKTQVSQLSLSNFTIYRETGAAEAGYLLHIPSGATIGRASLEGVRVLNELGGATSAISYAIDVAGALTRLWVSSMDPTLITAPLSGTGSTNITTIQGPGVTAAGLTAK